MDEALVRELIVAAIGDGRHEFGSFFLARFFGMTVSYEVDACAARIRPSKLNTRIDSLHPIQ
jgi:hypothetical protein